MCKQIWLLAHAVAMHACIAIIWRSNHVVKQQFKKSTTTTVQSLLYLESIPNGCYISVHYVRAITMGGWKLLGGEALLKNNNVVSVVLTKDMHIPYVQALTEHMCVALLYCSYTSESSTAVLLVCGVKIQPLSWRTPYHCHM